MAYPIGFEQYSKSLRDCGEPFQMSRSSRQKATDRARRFVAFGLPDRIRTDDLQSRSLTRYPAEPRVDYSLCDKENEKLQLNNKSELFWLGHRDSNPGNDGVRVRCLTAWRCPNIFNAPYYSRKKRRCQYLFSTFLKNLFFFFSKRSFLKLECTVFGYHDTKNRWLFSC